MTKIFEIKNGLSTKEFTLDYDKIKDKFYLAICAYGQIDTQTFFGQWALEEYLRDDWQFSAEQINQLYVDSKCFEE